MHLIKLLIHISTLTLNTLQPFRKKNKINKFNSKQSKHMLITYCYIKCVDKERNKRSITVCITNTKAAKRATASPDLIAAHALPVSSFFIHPNRTDTSL